MERRVNFHAVSAFCFLHIFLCSSVWAGEVSKVPLHEGWRLQSSRKVSDTGEAISLPAYSTNGWYSITVPTTVVAAQVASGEFKDPYFGMNLRDLPGMTYPIGLNSFSNLPMEKDSPYAVPWWYREEFQLPAEFVGRTVWLNFQGINYRANIWLNGRKLADSREVAGAYRTYEFDASDFVRSGPNALAVEVFAPTERELGINWVDWNPTPPDKDMGIWGDVYLASSGPVSVRYPQVVTHFPEKSLTEALLTVRVQLHNATANPVEGVLVAKIDGIRVRQKVALTANETRSVDFTPDQFSELQIKNPKLWWPAEMGTPELHDLTVGFAIGEAVSDLQHMRFGIREVTSELTEKGYRLFRVNGKRILIRGGAWAQDMLLRPAARERLEAEFQYVRDLHLNTIRMEAQIGPDAIFDQADEKGILIMAGWCCCDIWEKWDKWLPGTLPVATESLRSEALRLRNHPSLLTWLTGSDGPPPPDVEQAYLQVLREAAWPNPVVSSAADISSPVSGPSGVKMSGPYDYEPPSYWLLSRPPDSGKSLDDARYGGGFGYNTETCPGPAIPPLESLKKMLPKEHLWPVDNYWTYHGPGERFQDMAPYNGAMNATYGPAANLDDYLRKSQAMAYDGERAMYEAYGRNKYEATGVIQWTLNNAWPSTYWHLYDYFLYPAGGYFGAKKANEPLHVQYSYDDRSVVVVNNTLKEFRGLRVSAHLYDFNLKEIFAGQGELDADADSTNRVLNLPAIPAEPAGEVYFVELSLRDREGKEVSSNFYWLPAKLSTTEFEKASDTAVAAINTFEDLKALNELPKVPVEAKAHVEKVEGGDVVWVTLHNSSKSLAFQIHLGIHKAGQEDEVLPVLWEDNYVSLLPGESKSLKARFPGKQVLGKGATLAVDGWNIAPISVRLLEAGKD
jgi:exo-1,4-beta-D-glucosaminidase